MDAYLSQVSRYIHVNPVQVSGRKRMPPDKRLHYLWNYEWSSLPGYISKTKKSDFVEYDQVLAEYGGDNRAGRMRYKKQLADDLSAGLAIKEKIVGQSILGSERFVDWVRNTFLESKKERERPDVRKIHRYLSQEDVLTVVEKETGVKDVLRSTGRTRQVVMAVLYKYAGLNNREIGDLLGVDYSTVSQGRKGLLSKAEKDKQLKRLVEIVDARLSRIKI